MYFVLLDTEPTGWIYLVCIHAELLNNDSLIADKSKVQCLVVKSTHEGNDG